MSFRNFCFAALAGLALVSPGDGQAVDCVTRSKTGKIELSKNCSDLKLLVRSSPDIKPNAGTVAVYVEFDKPGKAFERKYNDWVTTQVSRLYFGSRGEVAEHQTATQFLDVYSIYRSKKILSARYLYSGCCGAHGSSEYRSINFEIGRGEVLSLGSLFRMHEVVNFCHRQMHGSDSLQEDFTAEEIALPPSQRRDTEFLRLLLSSESWAFTMTGAVVEFGYLHGYASGPLSCRLDNASLKSMARPGVSIPP